MKKIKLTLEQLVRLKNRKNKVRITESQLKTLPESILNKIKTKLTENTTNDPLTGFDLEDFKTEIHTVFLDLISHGKIILASDYWFDIATPPHIVLKIMENMGLVKNIDGKYKIKKSISDEEFNTLFKTMFVSVSSILNEYYQWWEGWEEPKQKPSRRRFIFTGIKTDYHSDFIVKDIDTNKHYYFTTDDINNEDFKDFAETKQSFDGDDWELSEDVIENYLNYHIEKGNIPFGKGYDDYESGFDGLIELDSELYDAIKSKDETTGYETLTTETTTTGSVGGTFVAPLGTKNDDYIIKRTIQELFDQHKTPLFADGALVDFDDCVKLNNNTEAQEGGCNQGDSGVVKYKKSKNSIVAKKNK